MKKSKYQQYFYFLIVSMLISYAFWFSYQQNIVTILTSVAFRGTVLIRGEALIRGRRLFQCGYSKVRHLLEGGAYLKAYVYQKKYGNYFQEANVKTNRMGSTEQTYHKERTFASNYLIFSKILFQFKNFVQSVDVMYQSPK